ncbi:MAG TPA: hypothetical protein VNZ22_09660, partial [Bacillota bacterium]|nr:hypothetical protein [Bacillota bacterium]
NQAGAIGWTIALTKGVPFLVSLLGRSLIGTLFDTFGSSPRGMLYTCTWWLPQLAILLFYVCLIRGAKRRLLGELAGAETLRWDLQQSLAETARDSAATIRKARHWTPH